MKNKLTDWLDADWHGLPRTIWLATGLIVGIAINLLISFVIIPLL